MLRDEAIAVGHPRRPSRGDGREARIEGLPDDGTDVPERVPEAPDLLARVEADHARVEAHLVVDRHAVYGLEVERPFHPFPFRQNVVREHRVSGPSVHVSVTPWYGG